MPDRVSDPWKVWKETAPPEAQVALDMALEGLAREPENIGFWWARSAMGEKGIPPILEGHVGRSLVLGVTWDALIQTEGDTKKILVDLEFPAMVPLQAGMVSISLLSYSTPEMKIAPPTCDVVLTRPYSVSSYLVTQRLWRAVMGSNPAKYQGEELRPVEQVTWVECVRFCNRLSVLAGLPPIYQVERPESQPPRTQKGGRVFRPVIKEDPHKIPEVVWNPGPGFRLLTDAEWLYAARAGSTDWIVPSEVLEEGAWHQGNSGGTPQPVGQKKPNAWGLYDMYGNVGEWVFDTYGTLPQGKLIDFVSTEEPRYRTHRGYDFRHSLEWMRQVPRNLMFPTDRSVGIGFRVAQSHV